MGEERRQEMVFNRIVLTPSLNLQYGFPPEDRGDKQDPQMVS